MNRQVYPLAVHDHSLPSEHWPAAFGVANLKLMKGRCILGIFYLPHFLKHIVLQTSQVDMYIWNGFQERNSQVLDNAFLTDVDVVKDELLQGAGLDWLWTSLVDTGTSGKAV